MEGSSGDAIGIGVLLVQLVFIVVGIVSIWKLFTRAGYPGWAAIVPFYNFYIFLKVAGRPGWWMLLFIIPFVNFIMAIIVSIDFAKSFGKGVGFGIGLAFLGFIFLPILAFTDAPYIGPGGVPAGAPAEAPPPAPAG